jgi:hypothetical protein
VYVWACACVPLCVFDCVPVRLCSCVCPPLTQGLMGAANEVAFTCDSRRLLGAGSDKRLLVWNTMTGQVGVLGAVCLHICGVCLHRNCPPLSSGSSLKSSRVGQAGGLCVLTVNTLCVHAVVAAVFVAAVVSGCAHIDGSW